MKDDEVAQIDAIERWRPSKKCIIISVVLISLLIVVVAVTTAVVSIEGEVYLVWGTNLVYTIQKQNTFCRAIDAERALFVGV